MAGLLDRGSAALVIFGTQISVRPDQWAAASEQQGRPIAEIVEREAASLRWLLGLADDVRRAAALSPRGDRGLSLGRGPTAIHQWLQAGD